MLASALSRAAATAQPALPSALDAAVANAAGTMAYAAAPKARAAVRANLDVVAGDRSPRDRDRLARRVFVEQVRNYIEIFRIPRLDRPALLELVRIEGWEHFVRAHAAGRGVITASAHLGPVSLCGQVIVAHGYQVTLPVEKETSPMARAINRARGGLGMRLVSTDALLGIHRALRHGGTLGILADRAVTGVGVRVPFFGREALLPTAHVVLALRTGAALVPAFARREAGRLYARFETPLDLERTGDYDADVRAGLVRWVRIVETHIRRAPEQWSVFERIWG